MPAGPEALLPVELVQTAAGVGVIVATVLQVAVAQAPNGGTMLVTSVSGALLPVATVLVVVVISAMEPASQMLT